MTNVNDLVAHLQVSQYPKKLKERNAWENPDGTAQLVALQTGEQEVLVWNSGGDKFLKYFET